MIKNNNGHKFMHQCSKVDRVAACLQESEARLNLACLESTTWDKGHSPAGDLSKQELHPNNPLFFGGGGQHSTKVAFALLTQHPLVQFSVFPIIFLKKYILDVAEIYQRHFLECGKFEYVDGNI